jgi:murein DD-endopeptidase MepM/ murein hydrolase activator NlpD
MKKKVIKRITIGLLALIVILNLLDTRAKISIPVENGTPAMWDRGSYWTYPWGESIVHRGIDIFGDLNTKIVSPVNGVVIKTGYSKNGGNYIYILSYDLKFYYFAHLNKINVNALKFVGRNQFIGLMGDTGNAKFAPFHLHFSIFSLVPIFKYLDFKPKRGFQKMFYLNPTKYFSK